MFKYIIGAITLSIAISVGSGAFNQQSQYKVYHMGATWCGPCEQMKQTTWKDENLKKFMKDNGFQLYMYDADKASHKKFFKYYNVTRYPTLIILDKDNLRQPLSKTSGYKSAEDVKSILEEVRTEE